MKKISLSTPIDVYASIDELPEKYRVLMQKAKEGLTKSYSPYSGFQVSAAALLENGEIMIGANQENAAYSMCLCAERVALAAATCDFPNIAVSAMAITVQNKINPVTIPAAPCGACRQVLSETEDRFNKKIKIILAGETGEIYALETAKDLLPLFFDGSLL